MIADREPIVAVEPVDLVHVCKALADDLKRAERQPHRNLVAGAERRNAADVIVVLMRHENRGQRFGLDAEPLETRSRVLDTEAAVDQHTRRAGFDDEPVAFATTTD